MNPFDWFEFILDLNEPLDLLLFVYATIVVYFITAIIFPKVKSQDSTPTSADTIPKTILTESPLTRLFIKGHSTGQKLPVSPPLYDQLIKLQAQQQLSYPPRLQIPFTRLDTDNPLISSLINNQCLICRRQINQEDNFGYYSCCLSFSHVTHVITWNSKSRYCPFCRSITSFVKISGVN